MKNDNWLPRPARVGILVASCLALLGPGCGPNLVMPVDSSSDAAPVVTVTLFVPGSNGTVERESVQAGGTVHAARNTDIQFSGTATNSVGGVIYFRLDAYGTTPCTSGNPVSFTAQREASPEPDGKVPESLGIAGANGDGTAGVRYAMCLKVTNQVDVHAEARTPSGLKTAFKITVLPLDPVAASITVSPTSIPNGSSAMLTWSAKNANQAFVSPLGNSSLNGSMPVNPSSTTIYKLTAAQPFPGPKAEFPGIGMRDVVASAEAKLTVTSAPSTGGFLTGHVKFRAIAGDLTSSQTAYAQLNGAGVGDTFAKMMYGQIPYRLDGAVKSIPFTIPKNLAAGSWTINAYVSSDPAGNAPITGFLQCTHTLPKPFGITFDFDQNKCD